MPTTLAFHGAASMVTGSCFLIDHDGTRFLVDCGMFQGNKTIRELNYRPFPFVPQEIAFVLLTHAHIDHSGLLPKLAKKGFSGPIHATEASCDLLGFMLPDSGHIQESEVEHLNKRNRRRGRPLVEPIYTRAEAEATLRQLSPCEYGRWLRPAPGIRARFWNAGHILGSASIEIEISEGRERPLRLLFSGDIGPDEKAFHDHPSAPAGLDYLVMESTYGDREREDRTIEERREHLRREVAEALSRGGNLVIPAFAVERTQELLYALTWLMHRGAIPKAPIFIDSPLAVRITEVFAKHRNELHEVEDPELMFKSPYIRFTETVEQSRAINRITGGAIIMAASGMCDAGRIRHHLRHNLWRPECTVLFVGYQAPGTLGHLILGGEKRVRIHGQEIAVRARIRSIEGYSAHADRSELLAWAKRRRPVRRTLFLDHGEEQALAALREALTAEGLDAEAIVVPELDETFTLELAEPPLRTRAAPRIAPELARAREDWHNAYARLLLDLGQRLQALPSDTGRLALLRRLRALLEEKGDGAARRAAGDGGRRAPRRRPDKA